MLLGLLLVLQILVCAALVGVILLQRSEGGALGMGGGPSGFMTARGAGDLLTRTTAILAGAFFLLSIVLTIVAGHGHGSSVVDRLKVDALNPEALSQKPATPPPAAAGQPAGAADQGQNVFSAPAPQVNTSPSAQAGAPPTTTGDAGAADPASKIFGVQTAPQSAKPAPSQPQAAPQTAPKK